MASTIGLTTAWPAPGEAQHRRRISATGPLRVHLRNPRYFTDGSSKAIYLTGSHVWGNLQDYGYGPDYKNPPPPFDYKAYLNMLEHYGHNFMRMWMWEASHATGGRTSDVAYWARPMPYQRTGPGKANDGGLKFDLTKFNEKFFDRLRSRIIAAGERGIYVSVMLFQGWNVFRFYKTHESWFYHPLHRDNNVNGLDGDPNRNGEGEEVHSLMIPEITRLQEAYVRKIINAVNDLDNVLFEISNETKPSEKTTVDTKAWEYQMARYIKRYETSKPKQHPVGVTSNSVYTSDVLDTSPSDWISLRRDWSKPETEHRLRIDPLVADGRKVSILDTDHIGAETFIKDAAFSRGWVWKAFLRGHNPILMDAFGIEDEMWKPNGAGFLAARQAMGNTRMYAERMNLVAMIPHTNLASTKYCLADPGKEYLVYLPDGGEVTVDLTSRLGAFRVEWFNPRTGKPTNGGTVQGGAKRSLRVPFGRDAVLYLKSQRKDG